MYIPCFHMKHPLRKLERSKITAMFSVLMLTLTFAILYFFVFPFISLNKFVYPLGTLFDLQFLAFFILLAKDPGFVQKSKKISFLKLNQYFKPIYLCSTCEIVRPNKSVHCLICNRCVSRYDHHCPWINHCVGIGNHNYFLAYLILIWTYLVYLLITCVYNFFIV